MKYKKGNNNFQKNNIMKELRNIYNNKHKVQKSCDFYGLDLAQGKMHMIFITLKELKQLKEIN